MDRTEIQKFLAVLSAAWPAFAVEAETAAVWGEELANVSVQTAKTAYDSMKLDETIRAYPNLGDLSRHLDRARRASNPEMTGLGAWKIADDISKRSIGPESAKMRLLDVMRVSYGANEQQRESDPNWYVAYRIWQAMKLVGGLSRFKSASGDSYSFLQREFVKAWDEVPLIIAERRARKLPRQSEPIPMDIDLIVNFENTGF